MYRMELMYSEYDSLWENWNIEVKKGEAHDDFIGTWLRVRFAVDFDWGPGTINGEHLPFAILTFPSEHDAIIFKLEGWLVYDGD